MVPLHLTPHLVVPQTGLLRLLQLPAGARHGPHLRLQAPHRPARHAARGQASTWVSCARNALVVCVRLTDYVYDI